MSAPGCRPSTPARRVLFVVAALVLGTLIVNGAPWPTRVVSSARILLNYPSLISSDTARALLADRERALAFAEETLEGELFRRLIVTIEPTLFISMGHSEPTEGGAAITFYVPACALAWFESDGTSPFEFAGCHEEVHAVAEYLWLGSDLRFGTLYALSEGVAVYVEELRRGTELRHSIVRALQASGCLYDVDRLLAEDWQDDSPEIVKLNVYYASASLVEFLIETYGMESLSELYAVEWQQLIVHGVRTQIVEADPAEEMFRIYGKTMRQIDTEWQTWIAADATGSPADADVFLRAYTSDIKRLDAAVVELEEVWSASPFRLVGPSSLVGGLYDQIADALYALADLHGDALTAAYDAFLESLDRLDGLLATWLDAIHALEEALPLIGEGEVSEQVVDLLEVAKAGYKRVEDTHMLDRVRELLAECGPTEAGSSPN
jgi:hypothetical protein